MESEDLELILTNNEEILLSEILDVLLQIKNELKKIRRVIKKQEVKVKCVKKR